MKFTLNKKDLSNLNFAMNIAHDGVNTRKEMNDLDSLEFKIRRLNEYAEDMEKRLIKISKALEIKKAN